MFLQVWRVENGDLVPQPKDMYGVFYTGDCYLVLYTYTKGTSRVEHYLLYFWQVNCVTSFSTPISRASVVWNTTCSTSGR